MDKVKSCSPHEIQLKSFFLGPQSENGEWVSALIGEIFSEWIEWRKQQFPKDGKAISHNDQNLSEFQKSRKNVESAVNELLKRFSEEVPKFSPRYMGHMVSEISLPALFGHIVTLLHNPNNISGESSRVGIAIEREAIADLHRMCGFNPFDGMGHFTSGGTVANFESVIRARARYDLWLATTAVGAANGVGLQSDIFFRGSQQGWNEYDRLYSKISQLDSFDKLIRNWSFNHCSRRDLIARLDHLQSSEYQEPVMLIPENKHYSWEKSLRLAGLCLDGLWPISLDSKGRISILKLNQLLERSLKERRPVLMCVSVLGSTELGTIDPINEVQSVLDLHYQKHGLQIWHHVDGAYGGFFSTLNFPGSSIDSRSLKSIQSVCSADSITIDPHKLGYVPYSSGAFLTRTKRDYYFSSFGKAPYIDFDIHVDKGPFTLEGSRSAAGAVATWMTAKTIGLGAAGYGALIDRTIRMKLDLEKRLKDSFTDLRLVPGTDSNIVGFLFAKETESLTAINRKNLNIYEHFSVASRSSFIVSKTALSLESYSGLIFDFTKQWNGTVDAKELVLIRMVLMNPFLGSKEMSIDYVGEFIKQLDDVLLKISQSN